MILYLEGHLDSSPRIRRHQQIWLPLKILPNGPVLRKVSKPLLPLKGPLSL